MKLRSLTTGLVAAVLGLTACAGGNRAHLDLVMEPGPGTAVDSVTARFATETGAENPETVATVQFDGRDIRLVRYTDPSSGEQCLAAVDGDTDPNSWCQQEFTPGYFGTVELSDEFRPVAGEAVLMAPDGTATAQVWTVFGYVIAVEPLDGLAYFAWNPDWGRASAIRLLDDAGEVIGMRSL
ncbi:MAG: hypothetical protein KJO18_10755 [Acidimicrobiia bacterium]|nr:hypothetical protein [Acidimicrobiia bacterium]